MKIAIDARMYGKNTRGIGRYISEMISEIEKQDKDNEYYIFLYKNNFDEYKTNAKNIHKILAPWRWYSLAEQIYFPFLLRKYNFDLVHFPHFTVPILYRRKYVVTIHDLILWFDNQQGVSLLSPIVYRIKKFFYKIIIKSVLKRAYKIIVPSNYTKNDILKINSKIESKISVIYEGIHKEAGACELDDNEFKIRYNIVKDFIFYIGAAYPHKMLSFLIENWDKLKSKYQLFLIGKKDAFYKKLELKVKELGLENNIIFTGFISDKEVKCFYKNAKAFIFPSRYEGFGLPPLEALANHCPVLASNKTCLPEILDGKVVYFDYTSESLLNAINNIDQAKLKLENIDDYLAQYTWKKMTNKILKIYQS